MARVIGKSATVAFEVFTQDQETEQLLQQAITNMVQALVNQDKATLKGVSSAPSGTKKKVTTQEPANKYSKERLEAPQLISLGGKWAYSVGIVGDVGGERSVRVAKGVLKGTYYRDKQSGNMVLKPDDEMHPISEPNKINIKSMDEWNQLVVLVTQRLKLIEVSGR
jgi:hypothetical protein